MMHLSCLFNVGFFVNVLFVTSEAYPLIKTGGLADVSGALPIALQTKGINIKILIPGYPAVLNQVKNMRRIGSLHALPNLTNVELLLGEMPDSHVSVIVIRSPELYERDGGPYVDNQGHEWLDNPSRFAALSRVAALLTSIESPLKDWVPDIIHCNDWQSALTPAYLHYMGAGRTIKNQVKTVLTLHNMAFQGNYAPGWLHGLGFPDESYQINGLEFYGQLSFLKAGIYFADKLTTVSPTYAKEIQTENFGFGMQGLLSDRSQDLVGILNGLDIDEWNPASDPHLPTNYDATSLHKKVEVKHALQQELGLAVGDAPLLGVVSRLTHQKGLDLLPQIADALVNEGCQIAVLGSGESPLEAQFKALAHQYPEQVSVTIGYNEPLSHRMMSGVDLFIMPSRFEPCGLNQMYGLRYGTPPLVNHTGGLADSVTDTKASTLADHTANGFVMKAANTDQLFSTIKKALTYYHDKATWQQIQRQGMQLNLGWDKSANAYIDLYTNMLKN